LPERLRTLVVSPDRELEPGMTVRATFTFRNQGGAPATGVRLRFNIPEGLVYLVGSGRLDGDDLDDEHGNSPLLSRAGANVGDVAPGEERRIEIAYSVAGAIENGTTVELQAALASFELPPVGSNVVRLVVRSKPQLRNALTRIAIEPQHEPVPGSEAVVTVRIHNAGQSSARDVVVVAPIPENAVYVPGSARVNGREIERELGTPFDRTYAPVVLRSLPANASATLSYRVRVESPLANATAIVAAAQVASQETAAFELEPAALTIAAAPEFGDDRTSLRADPAQNLQPGERVTLTLSAHNAGTADAERVSAVVELPEGLAAVRGASTIDGRAVRERRKEPLRFSLGRIGAGDGATLQLHAVAISPLPDATVLVPRATLEWEPADGIAQRELECTITVRSTPAFAARHNAIERRGNAKVRPGEPVEAAILLTNDGGAAAHDAVLHLRAEPTLDELALFEGNARLALERSGQGAPHADVADLGTIDAHAARRLTVRARVASPAPDRSEVRISATLHTRELGETPLRHVFWRVDSHPVFSAQSSRLELADDSILRPNALAPIDVVLANDGSDVAHNVGLWLYVSPEARLENVEGATREKSTLAFGEIPPGGRARARLNLRLLRGLAKEYPVTVDAVLTADAILPVPLHRLVIATTAEPDFSVANFRGEPAESVDAGDAVEWVLQLRNGGDGVAHHVAVAIAMPDALIYVPNSTTVNDVPVRDAGSLPPFARTEGVALSEVDPGVEAVIRWRTVVHNALPAGTTIRHVAHVRYDGDRDDEIASNELTVRSAPLFANAIPGLPFGLEGVVGPALAATTPVLETERFIQLPPATPVAEGNGAPPQMQLVAGFVEASTVAAATGTLLGLSAQRLAHTLRFLREARFGTLVSHLFAVRAFLPEAIGDAHCGALRALHESLREHLDRVFIKLRLPGYAPSARDVETPSLRATIERLLDEAAAARGVPGAAPTSAIELRGTFFPRELRELAETVASSELATAPPWTALARLLPDELPACARYRSQLIETLDSLSDERATDFLDALTNRRDSELDAALEEMTASLHATA